MIDFDSIRTAPADGKEYRDRCYDGVVGLLRERIDASMGVRDFCVWDTDDYKPWTRLWRFLSRLGHTEEITGFDITKYARTCRVNVLGGMQVGRYLPWWGG